jgi:hypothetical protein
MRTRRHSRTITFQRPFILDGFDKMQPAGSYVVETEEEELGTISVPAYRHMATTIILRSLGKTEYFRIDPGELDEAILRDSAPPVTQDNLSVPAWRGMDWVRRNKARGTGAQ